MGRILFMVAAIAFMSACEPRQGQQAEETVKVDSPNGMHEFVAEEVLQANSYTYVKGKEGANSVWVAIPKREVEVGKTYYYTNPMEMKNFQSKDLDRTFESVYFLQGISENANAQAQMQPMAPTDDNHKKKEAVQQKELNIQQGEGVVSIAKLYKNKTDYASKKVKVKGIVTKFNPSIMNKNWVHIQDGTSENNSFDLTITTLDNVGVGDVVTFEGVVAVDKDFGAGYTYDLIVEEAVRTNKKSEMKVN